MVMIDRAAAARAKCNQLAIDCGVPAATRTAMVQLCGLRLVHLIFNKKDTVRGKFKSLAEIGSAFVAELTNTTGRPMLNPFESAATPKALSALTAALMSEPVKDLLKRGIKADVLLVNKKVTYRVKSIANDKTLLLNVESKKEVTVETPSFLKSVMQNLYTKKVVKDLFAYTYMHNRSLFIGVHVIVSINGHTGGVHLCKCSRMPTLQLTRLTLPISNSPIAWSILK